MSTSQTALLVEFIIAIIVGMFYFIIQLKTMIQRQADYVATATALPLVGISISMGTTAVLDECE